jgi:hypothetical protein
MMTGLFFFVSNIWLNAEFSTCISYRSAVFKLYVIEGFRRGRNVA